MSRLLYVGQQIADDLKNGIDENLERYRTGDFIDMEASGDWRIPLSLDVDIEKLGGLRGEGGTEAEIENSLLVGNILSGLTPTLARENRLWIRLSHIECLEYARKRWLQEGLSDKDLAKSVSKHFFAPTLTGCRDDHAVSRLWWNHHIAKQIIPDSPIRALNVILARADIRLNFLERPGLAARPSLARGIVLSLEQNEDLLSGEQLFRAFLKQVNLRGAGLAFEVWTEDRINEFMNQCLQSVRS